MTNEEIINHLHTALEYYANGKHVIRYHTATPNASGYVDRVVDRGEVAKAALQVVRKGGAV